MAIGATLDVEEEKATGSDYDANMEVEESVSAKSIYKSNILNSVACSDAFFKSQQRGDKDLTFEEKREIACDLLEKNHMLFLQRYWKHIRVQDVPFFDDVRDDYEVDFYVQEIRKRNNEKGRRTRCQNRRYEALKKLVTEGNYFSLESMRERNPYLFEHLVGRYLSNEMRSALRKNDSKNSSFASFLVDQIGRNYVENLRRRQQDEEEAIVEEEDDDDDIEEEEEEEDEEEKMITCGINGGHISLPEAERQMLISEFTNIMYESFLSGRDNYDYSTVDDNEEYDGIEEREVDEEEKYFDAD